MTRIITRLCLTALAAACLLLSACAGFPTGRTRTRVIVDDDFEQGIVKVATQDPLGDPTGFRLAGEAPRLRAYLAMVDPSGKAGLYEHTGEAATGNKSIRIQTSPEVTIPYQPALSWWLHQNDVVRSGTLAISFDVLLPPENASGLQVLLRDSSSFRGHRGRGWDDHVSLKYQQGELILNEHHLIVSHGDWTHIALRLPMGEPDAPVSLAVTDSEYGTQTLAVPLQSPAYAVNWISFLAGGETDSYVLLDNLSIKVEGELRPASPPPPRPDPEPQSGPWQVTPAAVLDVFPEPDVQFAKAMRGETVQSGRYTPSGSLWGDGLDERWVFHHELDHRQGPHDSFALRIGKGGQLYSLRGAFGESVPPQGRGNPWNDEVWQFVSVCGRYNKQLARDKSLPEAVRDRVAKLDYAQTFFVHNSGAYIGRDIGIDNLYCPLLGAAETPDGRAYRTVNWGLVPQTRTIHRSPVLYYVQTRDVGNGVIEITYVVHNFSARDDIVFDWLNAPWGGTRYTSLPYHYLSAPDGKLRDRIWMSENAGAIGVRQTGGWNLSSTGEAPDSPSLALVFGRDRHLEAELARKQAGEPYCQYDGSIYRHMMAMGGSNWRSQDYRTRPENSYRNYEVAVVIPKFRLAPGTTIWYRSFLVVNRRDRTIELAKSLVDEVDYGRLTFDPATTPMVAVELSGVPPFKLFAKPVTGTMPLFLVENATTGQQVITTDPYIFVAKEKLDLGVPPDHPDHDYYNGACGYDMSKNNSHWQRLLGYGYVNKPATGTYRRVSSVAGPATFPAANTHHLDLWVAIDKAK